MKTKIVKRTDKQIKEALNKVDELVWFNRHQALKEKGRLDSAKSDIKDLAQKAEKRIVARYTEAELYPTSEFEWGMLNGKLSALRWIVGEEWDMLDT